MTFTAHLRELRSRLLKCLLATGAAFVFSYYYSVEIYEVVSRPLVAALPPEERFLVFTSVTEPFFVYLKLGFFSAVLIASPYILYQVWAFIAPGLYEREKRWFSALVGMSVGFFAAGVSFGYFIVFPFAFKYFIGLSGENLRPMITMGGYLGLSVKFLLVFGAVFQLPLGMLAAARIGLVTGRQLLGWWRYAVIICFIAAAILTPPDVVSQLLLGVPMVLLYLFGALLAVFLGKR
jgi:sec-independent protein translocase protein TatC